MARISFDALLQDNKIKGGLIVISAVLVILLLMATWLDKIHRAEKNIHQYWSVLESHYKRRYVIVEQFAQLLQHYAPNDQELILSLSKAAAAGKQFPLSEQIFNNRNLMYNFITIEKSVDGALQQMEREIPHLPQLTQDAQFQTLLNQLVSTQSQIKFGAKVLDNELQSYNRQLTGMPQEWVNMIYPRYPVKYTFHDIR